MGGKGRRRREKNYRAAHGGYSRLPPPPNPSQVDALPSKLRKIMSFAPHLQDGSFFLPFFLFLCLSLSLYISVVLFLIQVSLCVLEPAKLSRFNEQKRKRGDGDAEEVSTLILSLFFL